MYLCCDNRSTMSIVHNPLQHDHTKYIEIDKYFIKEKLDNSLICTLYMSTNSQLADVLTKCVNNPPSKLS